MKMSIVMGPTWIFEVVGWIIQEHTKIGAENAKLGCTPFDIINSLQVYTLPCKFLHLF